MVGEEVMSSLVEPFLSCIIDLVDVHSFQRRRIYIEVMFHLLFTPVEVYLKLVDGFAQRGKAKMVCLSAGRCLNLALCNAVEGFLPNILNVAVDGPFIDVVGKTQ